MSYFPPEVEGLSLEAHKSTFHPSELLNTECKDGLSLSLARKEIALHQFWQRPQRTLSELVGKHS